MLKNSVGVGAVSGVDYVSGVVEEATASNRSGVM